MRQVSGKEVVKALQKAGFSVVRQKGSHVHLARKGGSITRHITVPVHGNSELAQFVIGSIIRQSGLSREEFERLF